MGKENLTSHISIGRLIRWNPFLYASGRKKEAKTDHIERKCGTIILPKTMAEFLYAKAFRFCRRIEPQNSTKKLQRTLKSPPVTACAIRLWCLLASTGLHSIAREGAESDAS
jgi:hypothetical protein